MDTFEVYARPTPARAVTFIWEQQQLVVFLRANHGVDEAGLQQWYVQELLLCEYTIDTYVCVHEAGLQQGYIQNLRWCKYMTDSTRIVCV